jgi:hypothetical protein
MLKQLPKGGSYRYDLRQHGYDIIKDNIHNGASVFDFACGLGFIDIQLEKEKGCNVAGCDWSVVAVNYMNDNTKSKCFYKGSEIKGQYDYIIAVYFLEHIKNPVEWLEECFKHTSKVIVALPNDFNHGGEHVDMQWSSWDEFDKLFSKFKHKRLDIDKYQPMLNKGFKHPIVLFEEKGKVVKSVDIKKIYDYKGKVEKRIYRIIRKFEEETNTIVCDLEFANKGKADKHDWDIENDGVYTDIVMTTELHNMKEKIEG